MKYWIARDDYGLYLFEEKPYLKKNRMGVDVFRTRGNSYKIDGDLFYKEVTFENSPQEVELKLIEK